MTAQLDIASDLHCQWAYICILRLIKLRDELDLDLVIHHLYWPLELVNGWGLPQHILGVEIPVLAQHEPDAFARWRGDNWPSTFLPAFELVKAAEEQGLKAAESLDSALRRAFFFEQKNISLRTKLLEIAEGVDGVEFCALKDAFDSGRSRLVVLSEYEAVNKRGVQGSPDVYLPGGERIHNPGMSLKVEQGIPYIIQEDKSVYKRILEEAMDSYIAA